jgi:Family of unknown function (DUF6551)
VAIRQQALEELPPEGSQEEAEALVRQIPLKMPSYELKRIQIATLMVDYAPPYGTGYARPLSEGRLRHLRREWDSMACSPLIISRRHDGSLWVIDGNHRRYVAYEKGITQLPAMVFSDMERSREADLYTKLGTVLGQTPWTRFQSKLVAGDESTMDIVRIVESHDLTLNWIGYQDSRIQAVARVEWIYARGGPQGLDWTLGFLVSAFSGERESLGEMQLEGVFSFYLRYESKVTREEVARIVGAAGINAWHDRAASIWGRIDVGRRSNTYGMAIADMVNDTWRKKGKGLKSLLPAWTPNLGQVFPGGRFQDVRFSSRMNWSSKPDHNPAPQQLAQS